jgi:hypothetical protein
VQPVRAAARLSGRRLLAAAAVVAAAVAALALTVAASGRDARAPVAREPATRASAAPAPAPVARTQAQPVTRIGGKSLQSARCAQWRRATAPRRDAVVATLADVIGGPTPYGRASTLPPDVAHQLFDRTCRRRYARGFLLYELYSRAAAFYPAARRGV